MKSEIPDRLSALGHPQRLDIFRLLMRRYPDRVPAGEIAAALGLPASTLSAYLTTLVQTGLLERERQGNSIRYAVEMAQVRATFDHLLGDCCRGRPELCAPACPPRRPEGGAAMTDRRFSVLFLCTGNSARSLFAEALLRDEAGGRFQAFSAGTRLADAPNSAALEVLRGHGHDVSDLRPKSVESFQGDGAPVFDFVFTLCDRAANEDCAAWPGRPITGHWGVPDPVMAEGGEAERALAFREAYGALANRIRAFAALPVAALDRVALQSAVDGIARGDRAADVAPV